jgi:hypothetical protein
MIATADLSGTSPAAPSAGTPTIGAIASQAATNSFAADAYESITIEATLQGATGGTLDVYIQTSPDQGVTWTDYIHFPQIAAAATAVTYRANPNAWLGTINVVGKDLVPALAANTIAGGLPGDRLRVLYVAGSGTSAGALQKIRVFGVHARTDR